MEVKKLFMVAPIRIFKTLKINHNELNRNVVKQLLMTV